VTLAPGDQFGRRRIISAVSDAHDLGESSLCLHNPEGAKRVPDQMTDRWQARVVPPDHSRLRSKRGVEEEWVDHLIPNVPVSITILVVSVAVVFTVWVPVIMYRAGIRHGRSSSESLRLAGALMVVFALWFGLSAGYTQVEALHDGPDRTPWLVYVFFALIVVGPIAVARWSRLDELLADRRTLAELLISQTARWLGCVFLVLEVGGQLPGFFAYPAAFGDIAVGLTACVAVIALIWSTSTSIPIAWSVLGLLDFVGAVGTAFLATQALAVVHTDPPTSVFTYWPMLLFPAYLVPFSIILHITTIRVLLAIRRRARAEHRSVARSATMASG
jgi:hypothetical protein